MFGYRPLNQLSTLNYTWTTKYGSVNLIHNGKKLQILINNEHQSISVPLSNIKGLPTAIMETEPKILKAYLKDTYLQISLSENDNYNINIQHRIKGGGNIIDPVTEKSKLWANRIVPFEIDNQTYPVGERERVIILSAIEEWNASGTGFKLIPHTNEADYLVFGEATGVCYSNVGRQGGRQYVRCDLDGGGFNKRSIKHEIGHAVGLYHEHQRTDRDNYVNLRRNGKAADYAKAGISYGAYDFNSIMHYHFDGSSNLAEKPGTITSGAELVGTQDRLSQGDVAALNYLASKAPISQTNSFNFPSNAASQQMFAPEYEKLERRAMNAMKLENYAQAQNYFSALYNEYKQVIHPAKVAYWCNEYGVCAFRQGDYQQAKIGFENAYRIDPTLSIAADNFHEVNQIPERQRGRQPIFL